MTVWNVTKERRGETIRIAFEGGCQYLLYSVGATLLEWIHPDQTHLVARYRDLDMVGSGGQYLGALIGPTAGRIEQSRFVLDGKAYRVNEGAKHFLHGGTHGWHNAVFEIDQIKEEGSSLNVVLTLKGRHDVLPGTVDLSVTYVFEKDGWSIAFDATTDKPTLLNLTTHGYYSLLGNFDNDLADHELELDASRVIEVDDEIIGRNVLPVAGTPFDFLAPKPMTQAIHDPSLLAQGAKGLDHCFLLDHKKPFALRLTSPKTTKVLTVRTTYPGLTLYSTNYPKPDVIQNGSTLKWNGALAIEPQYPSNGINDPRFPDLILRPGERYHHEIAMTISEVGQ